MLCSRCKKNLAVVYISKIEGDKTVNEGICLKCAKELGIPQVTELMDRMGISDEDIESMSGELQDIMDGELSDTATFPFLDNLFQKPSENPDIDREQGNEKQDGFREKNKKPLKKKFVENYCVNLTQKAAKGEMDEIVGRDKEIFRVVQILNRRTKNNPCLIGEPGVGKTAIAEALAQRIVKGNVPEKLIGKEVLLLDLTALVAGTQFRGQFESRIKSLIDEVKKAGNIILVIDEVHNLVGAGDSEGSMNAANILKPALSRGEIQVIGATTFAEYRKYIEKDSALERRFQSVVVKEPSIADTIEILNGIKGYYEDYHKVKIPSKMLEQAVLLSERYITDRYLPDKAIDLIDEASSNVNLRNSDIKELEKTEKLLKETNEKYDTLMSEGNPDDYQEIAVIRTTQLKLQNDLVLAKKKAEDVKVTIDDLASVIELWTNIPAGKIREQESNRLSELENRLKSRIIGQDEAVKIVCAAIRRNRAGISLKRRPASFIFAGPTGVGKTELVKTLAADLFDVPEALIRLDMSEFMEKHSVSRIIGSPPGYVGYDEAGQLTEKIRRNPYSVILFDEIEKAHPDVLNILLQILDDGRITDAHGKTVNFENTVIIMTTNAGSDKKEQGMGFAKQELDLAKEKTEKALSEFLRPEFLNRVDEIAIFRSLSEEDFAKIAEIMLSDLKAALAVKQISLSYTPEVLSYLVKKSFSKKYGARNLRRQIQKEIEDEVASKIVMAKENEIAEISLEVSEDALKISAK